MTVRTNAVLWMVASLVLVAGFAIGVVGVGQNERLVKGLVRTPAGCSTTVSIDEPGTYYLYVETKGRVGSLEGCDNGARRYDLDAAPRVDVRVFDSRDQLVDQVDDDSIAYSTPSGVGESIASIEVDAPGRYVVEVRADDDSAVVALGRNAAVEANRTVLAAAAVVLLGLLAMVVALIGTVRRRRRTRRAATVVVYGSTSDSATVTWAPPQPQDRAGNVRGDEEP